MDSFAETFLNLAIAGQIWPLLVEGLWMTVLLSALSVPLAVAGGLAIALTADCPIRPIRWAFVGFVDLMRAIPPLVLLILIFYGLPFLGLELLPITATVLALALNGSSYFAEIFRAGLSSVPRGHREAARSTGLSWTQTMVHIVIPQGTRAVLPDLVSNTLELVKQTSIASAVALQELLRAAQIAQGLSYNPTPLILAAAVYLALFWPLVRLVSHLQNRGRRTGFGIAQRV